MEGEEVSFEGDARASVAAQEGGGFPKVVKRTVLKSEGGHTEVCIIPVFISKYHSAFVRFDRIELFF